MNFQEVSYAHKGSRENASKDGVSSGRSASSSGSRVSSSVGAEVEALGFKTSISVVLALDLGFVSSFAFLMGAGSGGAGTYCKLD